MKNCTECSAQFEYFPQEKKYYEKLDMPLPETCSECRQKRRMAFRNEKNLYYNKSFMSGRKIIALYPEDSPFRIIDQDEWWTDKFDATIYGRNFDFEKPFFEQFKELQKEVPRWSRIFLNCENCDFTNNCAETKNSYLSFSSMKSENIYYCVRMTRSKDCYDCMHTDECEYCSQCIDCKKCYNVHYSQLAENSHDSYFLYDCRGCEDCLMCAGIRKGRYMVLNKQYSKEEYKKQKEIFLKAIGQDKKEMLKKFEEIKRSIPHRAVHMSNAENCSGDFINDSKNTFNSFIVRNAEDCANVYTSFQMKDCYDSFACDLGELCLEVNTAYDTYNNQFSTYSCETHNSQYCDQCMNNESCFGCIGLKKQKHRILNKQYSEEEYKEMMVKIKAHMKKTGEWGKPFPYELSPFAYNLTMAQDEYPINEKEAKELGREWYEEKEMAKHFGEKCEITDDIKDADKSICDNILTCDVSKSSYKIIPKEFDFYKKMGLPIPRVSPDQRYIDLKSLQNDQKLRDYTCPECKKETVTTYPADTPYKILCEKCYLKKVY